jgi:hypothetical protein
MLATAEEKARKRLAVKVAKDIIKQIDLKVIKPIEGVYVEDLNGAKACEVAQLSDSKKQAKVLQKECEACALGSMFLSLVKIDNKFQFYAWDDEENMDSIVEVSEYEMRGRLEDVFTAEQLALIEGAFEVWGGDEEANSDDSVRAYKFGNRYKTPKRRLRAICLNIIDNKGLFVP